LAVGNFVEINAWFQRPQRFISKHFTIVLLVRNLVHKNLSKR
jgi:hypothetical protein